MRPQLTAFIALAMLIAACSNAPSPTDAPSPTVECDTAQWTPQPANMLGCEEAVAVATAALPADHLPIVRIQFRWGIYCPPGAFCPITPPSNGIVIFTFESPTGGQTTDAYMQIVRDDDGRVRVASQLTPIASSN